MGRKGDENGVGTERNKRIQRGEIYGLDRIYPDHHDVKEEKRKERIRVRLVGRIKSQDSTRRNDEGSRRTNCRLDENGCSRLMRKRESGK